VPTFPGTLDSLEAIRTFVGDAAARAGLDSGAVYRLSLAVDEVATNVVMHGYQENSCSGSIEVDSAIEDGMLVVRMFDTSPEYTPDDHEVLPEDLSVPLEDREPGGLGLFLTAQSVDDFRYERLDGRNLHDFRVNLP
jgi:anti-sigma regulatory factor (Ser/Thr protein kinase)